jgi:hypothetical protein
MNSFSLYLSNENSGWGTSTNFITELNDSRINADNYEVGLAQISFTNTLTINMGKLTFTSYMGPTGKTLKTDIEIQAKMNDTYISIFDNLNMKIAEIYRKNEFERRVFLRSLDLIKDNELFYDDIKSGIEKKIILPLKNDRTLDSLVYEQINLLTPKIKLDYYMSLSKNRNLAALHSLNNLNHTISYSGNITTLVPFLEGKIFNEILGGPQHVILESENIPDFSLLFVETDIIENDKFTNKNFQILKYIAPKIQSTPQMLDFSSSIEYKQLKYKESNERVKNDGERPSTINIRLKDKFFKNIDFNQGSILVKLNFRKKL